MDNNMLSTQEKSCRKQITFDLSDNQLKRIYPCPRLNLNPKYYKKAWKDIARFMAVNDFEHRQYSVYASNREMKPVEVNELVSAMSACMPWIGRCLEAIDVTNIGRQHDLMPFVEFLEAEKKTEKRAV